MKLFLCFLIYAFYSNTLHSQELQYRSVDYYFDIVKKIEIQSLQEAGIINSNLEIAAQYKEKNLKSLNKKGRAKYLDIKINVLRKFFKDCLYQQHITYKNEVYVLYFSMAGFDDTEWYILKWEKDKWNFQEKIDKELVYENTSNVEYGENKKLDFDFICFNYDEGPKNLSEVKIFVKNEYLIMEREGLYHSLFDLKNSKLLINEKCPWCRSKASDKEQMNGWIRENLHNKIEEIINR